MGKQQTRTREYQALVIEDFRNRVYPLALACAAVFGVFFLINVFETGKMIFIVADAIAAVLFALAGILVKRSLAPPYVGSMLILAIVLFFYIVIIMYGGSVHGMLFVYCVVPFFAFYLAGTRVGTGYGILMIVVLVSLWLAAQMQWLDISYNSLEVMVVAVVLVFTITSAWFFEHTRERVFAQAYQSGLSLETLMEALDEVYYRVGMDGIIQEIGESIYALTGYSPKDVENRHIETFYADPSTRQAYLQALRENGSVKNYPIEILGKYGQRVSISMSSRMFFDESGKPIYIEGLIRDMTQERAIQKERAENLRHLRALSVVESALSGQDFEVCLQEVVEKIRQMFDARKVFLCPARVSHANGRDVYQAVFEASSEHYDMDVEALTHDPEWESGMAQVLAEGPQAPLMLDVPSVFSAQLMQKYQLGTSLMVVLPIKPDVFWLLGLKADLEQSFSEQQKRLFVDIAHRVRGALGQLVLQKDLLATVERVEVASRAKSEFLATMSHELRTPLHGVIGLLDLLSEDMQKLPEEQQHNLALARISSQVLSSLIDDVLDLAKIESGKVEIQKQAFCLRDALHDALVPFVMKAREKGLSLSLEIKDVPAMIEGDVVRLRQVLLNLVGNAMKFTMQGYVRIVVLCDQDTLQINIEDSGIGIAADKQKEVFQPFAQVHDVHVLGENLQEKGTGLGTTISQHFVEMMGGTLELQSVPGVGSTMVIRLPLQPVGDERVTVMLDIDDFSRLQRQACCDDIRMKIKTWSVLLAEDDPVGRRIAAKRLLRAGFVVEEVSDGQSAWEKVQQQDYDLLLTDVRMPGMSGLELARNIRDREAKQGKKRMLIIGLSAYAMEDVRKDALDAGMDAFVSKPVDMRVLMRKLENLRGQGLAG